MNARKRLWIGWALVALGALLAVPVALYAVFFVAPREAVMGEVQRIFYFHVASAMNMLLAFCACGVSGLIYLVTRGRHPRVADVADAVAVGLAEVGVTLGFCVLVTGPLWARKAWGTWWTWEPRLTLSLLVVLLFIAVLALRAFAGNDRFSRSVAAGLSVLGLPVVYFIHVAVQQWGGAHPEVVYKGGLLQPEMRLAFWLSVGAMFLVAVALSVARARLELDRQAVDRLFVRLDLQE